MLRRGDGAKSNTVSHVETSYREFRPPLQLADRLVCFWTSKAVGPWPVHQQHVLPDGCVDIVWVGDREPTVAGPATRHVFVALPTGVDIVGLCFQPGSGRALLGLPADELLNATVPLADVWGRSVAGLRRSLRESGSPRGKLELLVEASLQRFANAGSNDPAVAACVAWLGREPGGRIETLAAISDLSSRQLQVGFGLPWATAPRFSSASSACSG